MEDTLVRVAGSTANPASRIGIVDLPDGQYRTEHGLVVTEDTLEAPPQSSGVAIVAVNGLEQRLKDQRFQQEDRRRIEAELKAFRAQVCNGVTINQVTYRNPQSQEDEAGAEVLLEGTSEPLGWISHEHLPSLPVNSRVYWSRAARTRSRFSARCLSKAPAVDTIHLQNMRSRIRAFQSP